MFQTVYLLCRDRGIAEDATQEAFARAFERWERLRNESWAGGWVTRTAINVTKRRLRRRPSPSPPPDQETDLDEAIDLWRAVARLPARQQQAVIVHHREGRPVSEVAQIMGCAQGTARAHLARAYAALRKSWEGADDVEGS